MGSGEKELGLRRGSEVEELLDEFCDDYVVASTVVVNDLSVGLIEMRESDGVLDQV